MKKEKVERELFFADLVTKRYEILRALYTSEGYTLTPLKKFLEKFREKNVDLSNLSNYIKILKENGLVLKEGRVIKLSGEAQEIVHAIVEAARPRYEKPWYPQKEEVEICLKVLRTAKTEESSYVFRKYLAAILYSGYWDGLLEKFFSENLKDPDSHVKEIGVLLSFQPRDSNIIEAFLKEKKEEIYKLIEIPVLGSMALRSFVNVNDRKEVIEKIKEDLYENKDYLDEERIVLLLNAAKGHGLEIYKKFGHELKVILREALEHESERVRTLASDLMGEVIYFR